MNKIKSRQDYLFTVWAGVSRYDRRRWNKCQRMFSRNILLNEVGCTAGVVLLVIGLRFTDSMYVNLAWITMLYE